MVNLRYHIVTIIAIFAAFTLGVVLGTTVIDDRIVTELRNNENRLAARLNEQRAANEELSAQLGMWATVGRTIFPPLISGALRGRAVVMVVASPVDRAVVDSLRDTMTEAGATLAGRIETTSKWRLNDPTARDQLALTLDRTEGTPDAPVLNEAAAERLAARFEAPAEPSDEDFLRRLERAGFVELVDLAPGSFPPPNAIVVFVASPERDASPDPATFVMPFLSEIAGSIPAGVAEPLAADGSITDRVTGDEALARAIVTADHADTLPGAYAFVAGIRDVLAGRPAPHYGVRRRASGVIPGS